MASKIGMKFVCGAVVLALAATNGVGLTFAGSPSKKPPSASINDLTKSADEAAQSGDYYTALDLYRQLAKKGDARAQCKLGVMLGDSDLKEALKLYQLSAAQGYAEAQYRLGTMYEQGEGVPRDQNEAVKWYQLAAAQGYAEAEYKLGTKHRPPAPVWRQEKTESRKTESRNYRSDPQPSMEDVKKQVALDAETQYEIAERNGNRTDKCVQAGFVAAAYLQAQDERNYARWKQI